MGAKPGTPAERFARHWKLKPETGCWIWQGANDGHGYGAFTFGHRDVRKAHRVSWEFANGPIPDGLAVLHNCPGGDNRACVNPAHLFLGTKADNNLDKVRKGRQPRGELSGGAKLSADQVLAILKDKRFQRAIAADYGISPSHVSTIRSKKTWKHITGGGA